MSSAEIKRISSRSDLTYGVLFWDGAPVCITLENPWKENERRVSCIPEGEYICKRYRSARYPNTFEVTGVPGRSKILFHIGNTTADTAGCILTGNYAWGTSIRASKNAFNRFMRAVGSLPSFKLRVSVLKPVTGYMLAR